MQLTGQNSTRVTLLFIPYTVVVQTTVTVGTRKHVHYRISARTKILYIRQPSAQAMQTTLSTTHAGMTSSTFKERYRNHIKSFTHKKYSNETELSKHIWHLKQNKTDFTIKWSIIKKSISYTGGSKRYNLRLEEKLNILKEKDNRLLNNRSEIISACLHKNGFQVKSLNKERNACYFNDNTPTRFLLEHKNSSHVFEIVYHLKIPEDIKHFPC